MHLFTTRGWAVLAPDLPPAVQNRMAETTDAMLAGVDAAIAAGVADPDRLGVFGQSNGGYTCLSVLTQTNRFKAGVMSAGFGDYFGSYGHMRIDGELYSSYYRESQNGGDPWAQRNLYIANSPWFSLDKVTTPLLVLHGEQDHTLPVWQAEAVVVGLARLGRTVSFARFTGEGHVPARWKWANQLEYDRRMIAWFEKYLR
jgi:dipeptidyl aminopeptidase/acylaminoacyl peptidase